ncbi:MAG: hypothetical protein NVS4B11_32000 [Ktedonobacteraceae bacterium]
MAEEKKISEPKQLRAAFVKDSELPIHFVNAVNIRAGLEEFYVTLGTIVPLEITDINELEGLQTINANSLFRFAMTRTVMKQVLDLMQSVYDQQTQQAEMLGATQKKEREDDGNSTVS